MVNLEKDVLEEENEKKKISFLRIIDEEKEVRLNLLKDSKNVFRRAFENFQIDTDYKKDGEKVMKKIRFEIAKKESSIKVTREKDKLSDSGGNLDAFACMRFNFFRVRQKSLLNNLSLELCL
jgi:hypothetical protein